MSVALEHDYIGLAEVPSTEGSDKFSHRINGLNMKATELRLGLPGSESPERDSGVEEKNVYPLGVLKSVVSAGAKRVFSDAINGGSGKWVLSGNGGSEMGFGKDGGLFSPKGVSTGRALTGAEGNNQRTGLVATIMKDNIPQSPKPSNEKKPELSSPAAKYFNLPLILSFSLLTCDFFSPVLCWLCSLWKHFYTLLVDVACVL